MRIWQSLIAFSFCWLALPAQAIKSGDIVMGAGLLPYNTFKASSSGDGSISFLNEIHYPIQFRGYWSVYEDWKFSPRIAYTLIPRDAKTKAGHISILLISLPFTQNFGSGGDWDYSFGLSYFRYEIKGKGGTTVLNNGTGTATFALPGRDQASQNIIWEGGIGYQINPQWHFSGDLLLASPLSERRAFSLLLSINYIFAGG